MHARFWLAMGLSTGCVSVEPSGDLFEPVVQTAPEPAPAPEAAPGVVEPGGFDFDADAMPETAGTDGELALGEVAAGLGLGGVDLGSAPPPVPVAGAKPATPAWNPQQPLDGSWGVRLLTTVPDAQPPRAVLGLPTGAEVVVSPGTLLPDLGIVVLAVGRDLVQVAEIIPVGDHARVETRILEPMYRQGVRPE